MNSPVSFCVFAAHVSTECSKTFMTSHQGAPSSLSLITIPRRRLRLKRQSDFRPVTNQTNMQDFQLADFHCASTPPTTNGHCCVAPWRRSRVVDGAGIVCLIVVDVHLRDKYSVSIIFILRLQGGLHQHTTGYGNFTDTIQEFHPFVFARHWHKVVV